MEEYWEHSYRENKEMWGWQPTISAINTLKFFNQQGFKKILIPGFGYGRNAKLFADSGLDVTGIEISTSAIELSKNHFDDCVKIFHGSVNDMPFEEVLYDGIYCYALLHLLNAKDRVKFIENCYNQLAPGGYMVFVTISKFHYKYEIGKELEIDSLLMPYGVTLYFYDSESIQRDFGALGLNYAILIDEPKSSVVDKFKRSFWCVTCKKNS